MYVVDQIWSVHTCTQADEKAKEVTVGTDGSSSHEEQQEKGSRKRKKHVAEKKKKRRKLNDEEEVTLQACS